MLCCLKSRTVSDLFPGRLYKFYQKAGFPSKEKRRHRMPLCLLQTGRLFYFLPLSDRLITSSRIRRYSQSTVKTRPKAALHSYSFG